ncbi:hypothetical protein BT96DRAFT_922175 [Gymnopus androsaceus JB14]|uniref:Uncharacterized protein n=1 Tax=Gymnopus androsaceus JB14 TaxID=1447944 RepID=A0A6A4HD98_9AGAR|nr:hypothetical protein BT96DRAFT_922175 [Gymnopus androsaceus JB14]
MTQRSSESNHEGMELASVQYQKRWVKKLSSVWLRTILLLLLIHPVLCLAGEMLWLYLFESYSFSDLCQLLSTWKPVGPAANSHITIQLFQIPWLIFTQFKLEFCIFPTLVVLLAFFTQTLKRRMGACARVCTQAILDPLKLDIAIGSGEVRGFSAQADCISDAEDVFSRVLQSVYSSGHGLRASADVEAPVDRVEAPIITHDVLYNRAFCAFIHCSLIALISFLKFSMIPIFTSVSAHGNGHSSLSPSGFIFALVFGLIYTLALLAVSVVWAMFAYHRLPTEDDMWSEFLNDVELTSQ